MLTTEIVEEEFGDYSRQRISNSSEIYDRSNLYIQNQSVDEELEQIHQHKFDSIEKKGTAEFNKMPKCNEDLIEMFEKPAYSHERISVQDNSMFVFMNI